MPTVRARQTNTATVAARARPASASSFAAGAPPVGRVHISSAGAARVVRQQTPELRALAEATAEREEFQQQLQAAGEFGQQLVLQLAEEEEETGKLRTQLAHAEAEIAKLEGRFVDGRAADLAELEELRAQAAEAEQLR